jgi:hypothetical protein
MTAATPSIESTAPASLTAADRCDRCGAQARVRVTLVSGDLLFCAHHAKDYEAPLRELALDWYDESHLVTA